MIIYLAGPCHLKEQEEELLLFLEGRCLPCNRLISPIQNYWRRSKMVLDFKRKKRS